MQRRFGLLRKLRFSLSPSFRNFAGSRKISRIDTTTNYKYLSVYLDPTLNLDMHFYKTYKKAAGRVNLLRRIRSNTDTLSAERIYRAMIMPIFTYCGQITLGWSETRRCQIRNLEQRSHRIILQNSGSSLHRGTQQEYSLKPLKLNITLLNVFLISVYMVDIGICLSPKNFSSVRNP